MLNFDYRDFPQPLRVFLCKPDNSFICELNGIEPNGASLELKLNNQYELEFDYYRHIENNGKIIESNGYDGLLIGMKLFVENIGFFKMKYPPYTYDGIKEYKHITANSIDVELEDKDLVSFKINTGEETSFEYLVKYKDGETEELLNPYTGIPYDYIVFYNTFSEQLIEIKEKYSNNAIITNADEIVELKTLCNVIPRLVNKPIKDENGNIAQSIDEDGNVMPAFTTYVTFNYNIDKTTILSITLTNFHDRIDELIAFYDRDTGYGKQLSLLDLAIENCGTMWTIGDIDSSLANKKCQFDIDGQNIYSFLTQDIAQQSNCIAVFDYVNYKINYISIENLGTDSGVIIDKYNLLNNLSIETNENDIVTRFNVSGGNDLNILDVNFGSNRIVNIDYYLNARDKNGNRIYVSNVLAEKYEKYQSDVELARTKYIEVAKQQRQAQQEIDEITYRVPNDIVQNDWGTFRLSELEAAEINYNNLLATLQTLYREDFPEGVNQDESINEVFIRTTPYWYDYYAYKEALIQIDCAKLAIQNNTTYSELTDEELIAQMNAWKTEWSLFGTKELECKILAYNDSLNVMLDAGSVLPILDSNGNPLSNKTILDWSGLSQSQKEEYASESQYTSAYNEYIKILNEHNSCQSYLDDTLKPQLANLQKKYDSVTTILNSIKLLVAVKTYNRSDLHDIISDIPNENVSFTDSEISVITNLYVDHNYSNENILITSIDDIVSVIDIEQELLEDAKEELSIESQPQFKFSSNIDNLICMPEFKDYNFAVGNYILLEYSEGYYIQLRLDTITFNPFAPEESLNVTFTNYIKSSSQRNDVSYILGENSGSSKSSSGSGGDSGSGVFGESDKIDVTISNTMLSKLLNTELFGSRVSNIILDTMKLNNLNAKQATFGSLATGQTTIDGACIETGSIRSTGGGGQSAYNGTVQNVYYQGEVIAKKYSLDGTIGSVINLYDGTFNFGGGKLIYDGNILNVKGAITAGSGSVIGGWNITDAKIYGGNTNNGELTAVMQLPPTSTGERTWVFAAGGSNHNDYSDCPFRVNYKGELYSTAGQIGGWNISEMGLYYGMNTNNPKAITPEGIYLSPNGIITNSKDGFVEYNSYYSQYHYHEDPRNVIIGAGGIGLYTVTKSGSEYPSDISFYNNSDMTLRIDHYGIEFYDKNGINGIGTTLQSDGLDTKQIHLDNVLYFNNDIRIFDKNEDYFFYQSYNNKVLYIGTQGDAAVPHNSYLRGKDIRLYSTSSGGIYLGASGSTAVTSDENLKDMFEIDERYENFFMNLTPILYTYKNTGHRKHIGYGARAVERALVNSNLTTEEFAGLVIQKDVTLPADEMQTEEDVDFETLYSLRYEEFGALYAHMLQKALKKIDDMDSQIISLKEEIVKLKS